MLPVNSNPVRSSFPMLDDWFNYVFTYFPTTNWQHSFSPTINFGSNVQDAPVEQHVVDQVGSYGFQLNRIIDALQVVLEDGKFKGQNQREKQVLDKFLTLARDADQSAREFKGEVTTQGVRQLIQKLRILRHSDPALYGSLVAEIQAAFPHRR
jgi:hypothetical protein